MSEPAEPRRRHRLLRGIWRLALLLAVWRTDAKPQNPSPAPRDEGSVGPSTREIVATARAEFLIAGLLLTTMLAGLGFALLLILDPNTQLLALTLGGALALFGLALALAAARLVPQVTATEPRPMYDRDTSASDDVAQRLRDGVEGVTRRRLLAASAAAALAGLAAAIAAPVIALGPGLTDALKNTPWRRGRRLVDINGTPVAASSLEVGGLPHSVRGGRRPRARDVRAGRRARRTVAAATAAPPLRLGARGDRRLLEDLHPRRLRGVAVSLAAEPDDRVRRPCAGLPLSLFDLRCARRRQRRVRPRGASAAATAAADRRGRQPAGCGPHVGPGRPVVVGRRPVSRQRDPLADPVRFVDERLGVGADGTLPDGLRVPRPLELPAR